VKNREGEYQDLKSNEWNERKGRSERNERIEMIERIEKNERNDKNENNEHPPLSYQNQTKSSYSYNRKQESAPSVSSFSKKFSPIKNESSAFEEKKKKIDSGNAFGLTYDSVSKEIDRRLKEYHKYPKTYVEETEEPNSNLIPSENLKVKVPQAEPKAYE